MWRSNFQFLLLRDLQRTKQLQALVAVDVVLHNLAHAV